MKNNTRTPPIDPPKPTRRELTERERANLHKTLPVGSTRVVETRDRRGNVVSTQEATIVGRAARRRAARGVRRGS